MDFGAAQVVQVDSDVVLMDFRCPGGLRCRFFGVLLSQIPRPRTVNLLNCVCVPVTPSNILIVSLAVSDLLVAVLEVQRPPELLRNPPGPPKSTRAAPKSTQIYSYYSKFQPDPKSTQTVPKSTRTAFKSSKAAPKFTRISDVY